MRKLGNRQDLCLRGLRDKGPYPGGWDYAGHAITVEIMEALAKRGLVDKESLLGRPGHQIQNYRYTINDAGRKVLET